MHSVMFASFNHTVNMGMHVGSRRWHGNVQHIINENPPFAAWHSQHGNVQHTVNQNAGPASPDVTANMRRHFPLAERHPNIPGELSFTREQLEILQAEERARENAQHDSQPPELTESYAALMFVAANPGTTFFDLREVNNPPIRPDWFVIERDHIIPGSVNDAAIELAPRVHFFWDYAMNGPSGTYTLARQMWMDMSGISTNLDVDADLLEDVLIDFAKKRLKWGDNVEVGTFVPQSSDNNLQHERRRRHVHRRLFLRLIQFHGAGAASRSVMWTSTKIEETWCQFMAHGRSDHPDRTFDELLASREPIAEWGEQQSQWPEQVTEQEEQ
ncbi:hypothetical protein QBC44DRAFT_376231 [Cladorrhinum sp. PSN332]|nr:hypothetical protein QBC44DRAFT_376231 [Cladorrhinum sp. PSN332]